jgi:hypothetical protein
VALSPDWVLNSRWPATGWRGKKRNKNQYCHLKPWPVIATSGI